MRRDGARAVNTPFEIDGDDGVELLVAHHAGHRPVLIFDELAVAQDAGVVDQHVHGTEPGGNLFHRTIYGSRAGDVHFLEHAARLRFAVLHVPRRDAAAFLREAARRGQPDARGAAGHDHRLPLQSRLDHLCLPPNVAHRETVRERVFRVHHVLREPGNPCPSGERRHHRGVRPDTRLFEQAPGKSRAENALVDEILVKSELSLRM